MSKSWKTPLALMSLVAVGALVWVGLALAVAQVDPNVDLWAHPTQVVMSGALALVALVAAVSRRDRTTVVIAAATVMWFIGDVVLTSFALGMVDLGSATHESVFIASRALWIVVALMALDYGPRGTAMVRVSDAAMFAMVFVFAILVVTRSWGSIADQPGLASANIVADGSAAALFFLAAIGVQRPFRLAYALFGVSSTLFLVANTSVIRSLTDAQTDHLWWIEASWTLAQGLRITAVILLLGVFGRQLPKPAHQDPRPLRMLLPVTLVVIGLAAVMQPFEEWGPTRRYLLIAIAITLVIREVVTWRVIKNYEIADQRARRELRRRADNDDLTGLLRRDRIFDRLRRSVARSRLEETPAAIAYVDLDDFSSINDNFGHAVGDRALIEVAARLSATRASLVGRIGGDEFLLGGFPTSQVQEPERLRHSIQEALERPLSVGGGVALRVTASVGVAVAESNQNITLEELIVAADHAAYREKRSSAQARIQSARSLLNVTSLDEVRRPLEAMALDRIAVWYQPVIELSTDTVAGAEALARIVEPDGSVKTAGSFVSILQAAGYGDDLTNLVLARATRDFAQPDVARRDWFVNVNVSDADLAGGGLIERVAEAMRTSTLEPRRLTLEIDERIDPTGPMIDVVDRLRALGVTLALDDFGAGSSAFGQIAQVAPSLLKLDIGLLPSLGSDTGMQSAALIEAFIRLAHHLGIGVIAEGVETDEQRRLLRSLGCEYGQGFLWSPAQALDHLLQWEADREREQKRLITG